MSRLPRIADLEASSTGWGFFLCSRKEVRTGRSGVLALVSDASGEIRASLQDVDTITQEFDAGNRQGTAAGNAFNQQLELIVEKIRRVMPDVRGRRVQGRGLHPQRAEPIDEMWRNSGRIASIEDPDSRSDHAYGERQPRPAADLACGENRPPRVSRRPARARAEAHRDRTALAERRRAPIRGAGAILHDIGKLEELSYEFSTDYTLAGNLVGTFAIGVGMLRDAIREMPDFPSACARAAAPVLSHHGSKELDRRSNR